MDQVVPAGRVGGLGSQHLEGEVAELGGQVGLVQVLERPGRQVPDQDAGGQLRHRRHVAGDRAGENVHLDATGGQDPGHLDDINIEATRVTGAGLLKR